VRYHNLRKATHFFCFAVFVTLPFMNLVRFDIPRQRFYFAGHELWISEFGIIFFALMFLMFVIVAVSLLYGRLYCSYLCPQMIFSEASIDLERWLKRLGNRKFAPLSPRCRNLVTRAAFYALLGAASVFLAFVFISYFVEPRDLFSRLMKLDVRTAGGIAGASVTLLTFLDFTFLRQRFCISVCPYGYLQGMLVDESTLLVQYRDEGRDCIECGKCVRVCHMGIDIRRSPYQIECVHCGECIDACSEILARLGKKGLIHYVWGERGGLISAKEGSWHQRMGFRDAKRVVILLVILFYASGLGVALSMRKPVLVQVSPERSTLYQVSDSGIVSNRFRVRVANRSSRPANARLSTEGLPGAALEPDTVDAPAGAQVEREFEIRTLPFAGSSDVNSFRIVVRVSPGGGEDRIPMTFIMPAGGSK
jgi:cytochrome c oxidase accessory protein FixG